MIDANKVLAHLEYILNSNNRMLVNKKQIEIIWAVMPWENTAKGFAKIDNTILPLYVGVFDDVVEVKIGDVEFELNEETIKTALEEIKND
ncbi:hypothetical protein [Saccharolobus caldissimus]|uniref:Uncharacterized protein n=1 Tax=Saccharolobus caldissimus TaxID=1702097 RepID=A0AAQ4CPJ9_9CREN|nr:hypothetical protein [Saccharolobus caldissimus]BDB97730.1 hypothetical protein SACC_07470 [Saccharolobus caldissimus]